MERVSSIRKKIAGNFILIILSIVILLNILLIIYVKKYYYDNMQGVLSNQLQTSINFYNKYFSDHTLLELIYENVDAFWEQNSAQIQILDANGNLLMDSIGTSSYSIVNTPDIEKAKNGEEGRWVGYVDYSTEKVMVISKPVINNGKLVGIIRCISSLTGIDETIKAIIIFFIIVSIIVISIGIFVSLLLANSIIKPIEKLTSIAESMAEGNLSVLCEVNKNDEIGKLSKTFNYMANEIRKREELKNDFISSISHELRTPLTSIKGWVITLKDDYTDKETLDIGFNIIENETERLSSMVEELLDFSRLINGGIDLNIADVNLREFIEYIKLYMEPRANRDGVNYTVNIINELGVISIDKNRLKQVLINILDNSFKFTERGGSVHFQICKKNNTIEFLIKDTGCGIPIDDLPKVKEKFYKGKNSKSQNGIGLSICDEIIKLHKGELKIESEKGKGTSVTVIIPINLMGEI